MRMDLETSVQYYLAKPILKFKGRGSRLRNNLRVYWRGLVEERHALGVRLAKQVYWLEQKSVFAILKHLKPANYNTVEQYMHQV